MHQVMHKLLPLREHNGNDQRHNMYHVRQGQWIRLQGLRESDIIDLYSHSHLEKQPLHPLLSSPFQ
jgi:hypothetical protein